MHYRWQLLADPNFDGVLSVSDVWIWIKWLYFAPGDAIILFIYQIDFLKTFFELSHHSYGNWFSGLVGAPFTMAAVLMALVAVEGLFPRYK